MAGEAIKSFRLFVLRPQEDVLLRELLLCGVEFTEADAALAAQLSPETGTVDQRQAARDMLRRALEILDACVPEKRKPLFSKKPQIARQIFLDQRNIPIVQQTAEQIVDFQERRRLRLVELGHLRSQITALQPWQTLDLPLDFAGTEQCCVVLGTAPASVRTSELQSALTKVSGSAVLLPVSAGKEGQYLELICFHELREACIAGLEPYGFSVVCFPEGTGIAAEAIQAAETLQTRLQAEVEALTAALAAMGECRADLQLGLDQLTLQIAAEVEKGRLSGTEQTVYLQGLAAAQNAEMLEGIFARYSCAWEWTEAEPTARKRFRPYTFVTRYTEPDRNK